MIPGEEYGLKVSEDGYTVTYTGPFFYVGEDDINARGRGLYSEEDRTDTRRGSVTLRKK